jgi:osmotically-inducible protein OsmY
MRNLNKLVLMSALVVGTAVSSAAFAESAGQYVDDSAVTAKVKAALLADKQLKATQVSVETNQGTVQLSGTVDSKDQESKAVHDANQVAGVKSVNDLLQIRGTQEQ